MHGYYYYNLIFYFSIDLLKPSSSEDGFLALSANHYIIFYFIFIVFIV